VNFAGVSLDGVSFDGRTTITTLFVTSHAQPGTQAHLLVEERVMATREAQHKWRQTNRYVKRQLNVMAREHIHIKLDEFASGFNLRGKGEAVTFSTFVTHLLMQRAEFSDEARKILEDATAAYHRDRDLYIN
jgi:hypothetical protein